MKNKGKDIIKKVAKVNGVSEAEVRKEINIAIDEGMKSTDPEAMAFWAQLSKNGRRPTPEEVVEKLSAATGN